MLFNAQELSLQKITLAKDPSCICSNKNNDNIDESNQVSQCEATQSELEISIKDFTQYQQDQSARIIDVRTVEERKAFHIGGEHLELASLLQTPEVLNKSNIIVFYCQSGVRSLKAAEELSARGYHCFNLKGGILNWLRENAEKKS